MKVLLLCMFAAVALSQPVSYPDEDEAEWELFKIEHENDYGDEAEENLRKEAFMNNLNFIREHNKKYDRGEITFSVEVNKFADLTNKEYRERFGGFKVPAGHVRRGSMFEMDENMEDPASVDWRTKGAVTPVKDQGIWCNSAWAFSTTGSLEGQTFLKTKTLTSLSEQNLMDCSKGWNLGCFGGDYDYAFEYIKTNQGIDTEESYPYKATNQSCQYDAKNKGATCTGYVDIQSGSEKALQKAVANIGPVSSTIDTFHDSFRFYKNGVYKEPKCSTFFVDQGVVVVGYGTAKKGGDYWIVKNSWSTAWGMKGYILMARNDKNMCGIASQASYPTV